MQEFLQTAIDFTKTNSNLLTYLVIPVVAALVGWLTNILALRMTFYPMEFMGFEIYGVRPVGWKGIGLTAIGWQGIVPSKAEVMAGKAVDLLVGKLISVEEEFDKLDPEIIVEEMTPKLEALSKTIIEETMEKQLPLMWKNLPSMQKRRIYKTASKELPNVAEAMMVDIRDHITEIWDVKEMVVGALTKDKALLNRIFLECGKEEFKFIEHSGIYFGFAFGLIQMVIWYFFPYWWLLPLGGLLIGYATNWLALKLIFYPQNPHKVGPFTVQGLFIKRQKEVSKEYAKIVTSNILNPPKIFDAIIHGSGAKNLMTIVQEHVEAGINKTAGFNRTLIQLTAGTKKYEEIKRIATKRFIKELPDSVQIVFDYAEKTLDLENNLANKMGNLPPSDFVGFLRPVFQEDEMKLIIVGAVLGALAGWIQVLFLLG